MFKVAIDVGGTFTDTVVISEDDDIRLFKVSSTPFDFAQGVMNCLKKAAHSYSLDLHEFLRKTDLIVHGTTVATNAMLTNSGVKTGLITTKGFRDVLELRRGMRFTLYNYKVPFPRMLSPRFLRTEVEERILHSGKVKTPLNEDDVHKAIKWLKENHAEAIAVCFLFSFLFPKHEERVAEIIKEEYPEAYISISSEILPQVREFERTSTTVINAYVGPLISRYLNRLEKSLKDSGFGQQLLVMQSNGGVQSVELSTRYAVNTISSGPSAGIPAAIYFANALGSENVISIDMGGTSFDVALVEKNSAMTTAEKWIGGHRIAIPMLDIHNIGAGSGSIAWIDPGEILRVGPQSAGADPGPACYGKGGKRPTVTDADLILGYINPDYFLGGEIKLDVEEARKSIKQEIGDKLNIDVIEAANAIFGLINATMADAISFVSVQRGYDPKDFVLCAAGGAGPIHAMRLAEEIGIPRIIIPKIAPVYCALGMLLSDLKHVYARSYYSRTEEVVIKKINDTYEQMERNGIKALEREGIPPEDIYLIRSADMRYIGQVHEVEVLVPGGYLDMDAIKSMEEKFHQSHEALYTFSDRGSGTEILTYRVTAIGRTKKPTLTEKPYNGKDPSHALKGLRETFFMEYNGFAKSPIYDGDRLLPGNRVKGPGVIEEVAMTVVIPPDHELWVDKYGNYVIELK